jgi:hypothetical protein
MLDRMDLRDEQIANLRRTNAELRERIRQLEAAMTDSWLPPLEMKLNRTDIYVAGLLMTKQIATEADIYTVLYGHKSACDIPTCNRIVSVVIYRLRGKLFPYDIHIRCRYRYGWYITEEDKQKMRSGRLTLVEKPRNVAKVDLEWRRGRRKGYEPRGRVIGQGNWAR